MSGNALLDSIANPRVLSPNLLADSYGKGSEIANSMWRNKLYQSQQAAGDAFRASLSPDGTPNQPLLNQNLARDPNTSLSAQETSQRGQTLDNSTFDTHMKRLTGMNAAAVALTAQYPNGVPLKAIQDELKRVGPIYGLTPQQMSQGEAQFGDDPVANSRTIIRNSVSNLNAQEALHASRPGTGTVTGTDGTLQGYQVAPTAAGPGAGAVSSPQQPGAPQGPGADTLSGVSTITDSQGVPHVDSLAGHIQAGRVSPMGQPNPGYSQATASPAMVDALRGQEGTPNGQTSVAGARGQMQVTPGFFKQYAQPGESFDSKADVESVAKRGIAALEAKYPNDPGRIATAYFSGAGNVAPPGSPTPYIQDTKDGNGTATSAYVAGATGRYKTAPGGAASQTAPGPRMGGTAGPAPMLLKVQQDSVDQYGADSRAAGTYQDRVLPLQQAAKALETAKTGEGSETLQSIASRIQTLTPDALKNIVPNIRTPDEIAAYDEARKYLAIAQQNRPGANRSDAGQALADASSPSPHISPAAAKLLVQAQLGVERSKQAQLLEFNETHAQGTEGQYLRWLSDRAAKIDPRAFITDQQSVTQRKTLYDQLGATEKTNYLQSYALAKKHGLLTLPNGQ